MNLAKKVSEKSNGKQKKYRKANGTLLYDTDYNNMAEFEFKLLYDEIKSNLPFLMDILNTVSGLKISHIITIVLVYFI